MSSVALDKAKQELNKALSALQAVEIDKISLTCHNKIALAFLLAKHNVDLLTKIDEWDKRRQEVQLLQQVLQAINAHSKDGELALAAINPAQTAAAAPAQPGEAASPASPAQPAEFDIRAALVNIKEKLGVHLQIKDKYDKADRQGLVSNLEMKLSDLNLTNTITINEMQEKTNMRFESLQWAHRIMKTQHESGVSVCRNIRG